MKRIILTGGGTAGHVTPNIALLPRLKELQYDIHYIGSYNGIEKELIEQFGIPYHGISSGKLRRYFSVQNFTDPFRVLKGLGEAKRLIKILDVYKRQFRYSSRLESPLPAQEITSLEGSMLSAFASRRRFKAPSSFLVLFSIST